MRHSLFLHAAVLSALSLVPYLALAQEAVDGFDVFVTPTNNEVVAAGSNFDIIWTPSPPAGPVTIRLMQGSSELNQDFGPTIASGIDSTLGKYTWAIPSSYGDYASYGFKLQLDSNNTIFQYSYPFIISKSGSQSSASASQTPVLTSMAVVTSTSVVTQSNSPSDPKATATSQAATSSSNTPNNPPTGASPTSASNSISSNSPANPTSPTSSAGNGLQTGVTSSSSSSSTSGPYAASTTDNGLSVGAKAGITIGAVVGVCIIGLLAYIAILMRRKNTRKGPVLVESDEPIEKMSELGPGVMFSEMDATKDPQELEGGAGGKFGSDDRRWKRKSNRLESIAELP